MNKRPLHVTSGALGGDQVHGWKQDGLGLTVARFRAETRLPAHVHRHGTINIVTCGEYVETLRNGRTISHPSASLIVKPGGTVHSNSFSGFVDCVVLEVSNERIDELGDGKNLLDDYASCPSPMAARLGAQAIRELASRDEYSSLALEGISLELLAEACRSLGGRRPERSRPPWLAHVEEQLRERSFDTTIASIADRLQLHPVYVARVFRARFGCSIGEYRRRELLAEAARRLRETTQPISRIGLELGFCDQSHFTRVFRRLFGIPPSAYRHQFHPQKTVSYS